MKVLHVETGMNLYGGAKQVQYLLQGLQERGIENVLVSPRGSEIAKLAGNYIKRGYTPPMRGDLDLGFIFRLRQILKQERPDILHLHSRRGADTLGGIAGRLSAVQTILTRRVDNPESRFIAAIKYRLYDHVITISEGIRQVLLHEGVSAERLTCVHSAVDTHVWQAPCNRQTIGDAFGLHEHHIVIGVIAQLIERKGHRYLLEALPAVVAQHPNLKLLILGKGPLESAIHEQIVSLGLAEYVILAGFREDLESIIPCLDLVVHPALMEGLGVSLLQAASAGKPIIASRAGGMPEVVRDAENGLLVPPADVMALQQAMLHLLNDAGYRRRLGEQGRAFMASAFSIDAMVEGNLAVYQSILA